MGTYTRPENALKRAKELVAVNQKAQAIQVMHDALTKRQRVWQPAFEELMKKYIELTVELRKGKLAKDGLHQYRNLCSQANIGSLETIIRYFLQRAESYAREAQEKAEKVVIDIEDLEAEDADRDLTVSTDESQKPEEVVTPWLKFLWETFRTVLEILRNNPKLEALYQETAQQAFQFCLRYKRTTEFRRLADILRNHLKQLKEASHGGAPAPILASPESLQLHLETRFIQLNVAADLELWQEAFRSVEDIHGLMAMSKKQPKPATLTAYYQKLAHIFWLSNNYLFHAYAFYKYFTLNRATNKNATPEQLRQDSTALLLAALSIPLPVKKAADHISDYDVQKEKNLRMATLLGFSINPKRETLLAELIGKNITASVAPELKDLYFLLEKKFDPLELCKQVKVKLDFIAADPKLKQYVRPLEKLLYIRLLQQLAKVYAVMRMSEIRRLAPFLNAHDMERWTVETIKLIEGRVDHQNGAILFGSQMLESEKMRCQLTELSRNLQLAVEMIHPERKAEREAAKRATFASLAAEVEAEHNRLLERKIHIEKRKELQEVLERIKLREEELKKKAEEEARAAAAAETTTRLSGGGCARAEAAPGTQEAPPVTTAQQEMLEKLRRARMKMDKKLAKMAKRMEHLERARREAEKPYLEAAIEAWQKEDKANYEKNVEAMLKQHQQAWQTDIEEKKRLARMKALRDEFEKKLTARRAEDYQKKKAEQDARLGSVRAKIEELKEARRKAIEEHRLEEERKQKQREEEERKRREEEEARRREEEARRTKLQEQAELQRKREMEAMEKQRRLEEEARRATGGRPEPSGAAWRRPVEGGTYRPPAARRDDEGPYRPPAVRDEGSWRRDEHYRPPAAREEGAYRPPMRRDEGPRRDEGSWRREEPYRPPAARDEGSWRREEGPRRDEGSWRRDEGSRRDEGAYRLPMRRDEGPRREEGPYRPPAARDESAYRPPGRREEGGAYRPPAARRDEGSRREEGPRHDEGGPRRSEQRPPESRAPPAARKEDERKTSEKPAAQTDDADEGWETVKKKRGK